MTLGIDKITVVQPDRQKVYMALRSYIPRKSIGAIPSCLIRRVCSSSLFIAPPDKIGRRTFDTFRKKVPTERFPLFFSMSLQMVLSELFVAFLGVPAK